MDVPPHIVFMIPEGGPYTMGRVNQDQAVAWTNRFGGGRVFAISIGHGVDTIRRPGLVARCCCAAEWAATGAVTLERPDLSGEDRRRAWPYYCDLSPAELPALTP